MDNKTTTWDVVTAIGSLIVAMTIAVGAVAGVVLLALSLVLIRIGVPLLLILYFGHLLQLWCLPTWFLFIPEDSACQSWLIGK